MKQLLSILALVTLLFMTQSCSKEMANKAKASTASDISNAATTSHVTYTFNKQWKLLNFCDGELVDLSGIAKFDIQTVRNNNTSKLIGTGVFSNLTGVEPNTGIKWVGNVTETGTATFEEYNSANTYDLVYYEKFTSQGGTTIRFKVNVHLITDATGSIRVDFGDPPGDIEVKCR